MARSDPYVFCFYDENALEEREVRKYTRTKEGGNTTIVNPMPFRGPSNANSIIGEVRDPAKYYDARPVLVVSGDQRVIVHQTSSAGYYNAIQSLGKKFQHRPEIVMMFDSSSHNLVDGKTASQLVDGVRRSVKDENFVKVPTVSSFSY